MHFKRRGNLLFGLALHTVVLNEVIDEIEEYSRDHLNRMLLRVFREIVDNFKCLCQVPVGNRRYQLKVVVIFRNTDVAFNILGGQGAILTHRYIEPGCHRRRRQL